MLHILLLILKIIGIVLGILAGIILTSLTLALFVPVRYQIEAERAEGAGNPPIEAKAKVTWLFHFINIRVLYPAETYVRARIFLFTVFQMPPKSKRAKPGKGGGRKKNRKKKKGKTRKKNEKDGVRGGETQNDTDRNDEALDDAVMEDAVRDKTGGDRAADDIVSDDAAREEGGAGEEAGQTLAAEGKQPKSTWKEKLIKIWKFFQNIWYTLKGICDRIREILENIEYYLDILKSDTFQQAYSLCKYELGSIFAYIKPRKFQADLTVGMGDPAATGQILSYYYGILYPVVGSHVTVVGDFDRKRIEGSVYVKGKIRLFTFLKAAIRIYFNKDIKKLIKLFKKEDV